MRVTWETVGLIRLVREERLRDAVSVLCREEARGIGFGPAFVEALDEGGRVLWSGYYPDADALVALAGELRRERRLYGQPDVRQGPASMQTRQREPPGSSPTGCDVELARVSSRRRKGSAP